MTFGRLATAIRAALVVVVLVTSGAYMLVYLYRWEWNRALIAGVFFVAAEVAAATSVVLRRLARVEQRLAAGAPPANGELRAALRTAPVARRNPFAWLDPADPRLSVFVPVLLGAGVVLSAVAYLVERVATATARPVLEPALVTRLAAIAPPNRPLVAGTAPPAPAAGPRAGRSVPAVAVLALALGLGVAIQLVMEATQSRPVVGRLPASSTIEVDIDQRGHAVATDAALGALWTACRPAIPRSPAREVTLRVDGALGGSGAITLRPGVGDTAMRRLTGCLSDATLPLVWATARPAG